MTELKTNVVSTVDIFSLKAYLRDKIIHITLFTNCFMLYVHKTFTKHDKKVITLKVDMHVPKEQLVNKRCN